MTFYTALNLFSFFFSLSTELSDILGKQFKRRTLIFGRIISEQVFAECLLSCRQRSNYRLRLTVSRCLSAQPESIRRNIRERINGFILRNQLAFPTKILKTGRFGVIKFNVFYYSFLLRHTAESGCVPKAVRGHEAVTHKRMGVRPSSGVQIHVEVFKNKEFTE